MGLRRAIVYVLAGLAAPVMAALTVGIGFGTAQTMPARISFQIVTGSTGGTYFPVGQLIAGLISHAPGVDRCESAAVCGPSGLIITARTSEGAVANVLAVNRGSADSGFAQGDVVGEAVAGEGAFRKAGKQGHVRVIADLFPEDVHLIVAKNSKIAKVADLRGKRVSLGVESSGTSVTARAILAAYDLPVSRLKIRHDSADADAQLLQLRQIDAFFFVGSRPVGLVDELISSGVARLVPIDGAGRDELIKENPALASDTIPSGTYRHTRAVETVSVHAVWIVNDRESDELVYGITKALFHPGNRAALNGDDSTAPIRIEAATADLPAPLHPGSARYFREIGRLPKTATRAGKN
jgi:TRAP transporter TAXI family solute receptor